MNFLLLFTLLAASIIAYLLGSLNFAIIVTHIFKKDDIRNYGSGNAGMSNVLRTVGKGAALLTLLGDFSKGIIAVFIARLLFTYVCGVPVFISGEFVVAYCALLGHTFPIFYKLKGGKGILVSAGAALILSPPALAISLTGFILAVIITRYISLGSIVAGVLFPIGIIVDNLLFNGQVINWLTFVMAFPIPALIIYLHKDNIKRLMNKTENKVNFNKK